MAQTNPTITVHGPTTERTTSPYGMDGCGETLHVTIDGEDVYVPWTAVRPAAYDYYGETPDQFNTDRLILVDGHIHAEADIDGGILELIPEYSTASAEFRSYDTWEFHRFEMDHSTDDDLDAHPHQIIYTRPDTDD